MKTLAVDFDGVIHRYSKGYHDGSVYDPPHEGAIDALNTLHDQGYQIIIHTTRRKEEVLPYLEEHGLKFTPDYHQKPMAQAYIDDRALRFTNWHDIRRYFL